MWSLKFFGGICAAGYGVRRRGGGNRRNRERERGG